MLIRVLGNVLMVLSNVQLHVMMIFLYLINVVLSYTAI